MLHSKPQWNRIMTNSQNIYSNISTSTVTPTGGKCLASRSWHRSHGSLTEGATNCGVTTNYGVAVGSRSARRDKKSVTCMMQNHSWENATVASHLDQRQETPEASSKWWNGWMTICSTATDHQIKTDISSREETTWPNIGDSQRGTKANLSSKEGSRVEIGKGTADRWRNSWQMKEQSHGVT